MKLYHSPKVVMPEHTHIRTYIHFYIDGLTKSVMLWEEFLKFLELNFRICHCLSVYKFQDVLLFVCLLGPVLCSRSSWRIMHSLAY
jgi:hypothetical protein